ncbi:MAG: pentapeptide repeat-containing protein [Verrucomicrobia bacterium]|nr:pentapeptide repeat-containing protein [Verrucomicrobiota bacterium]
MAVLKRRTRPEPWRRQRAQAKYAWLVPVFALEWSWRWLAYLLSGWAFLEVLEYFGTLSLLVAAVSYFGESKDRIKQKHYQAWQVINSAQGKGGSGGRIDALEELHRDGVLLVGVDVSDAFLQGVDLKGANLLRANFRSADIRDGSFVGAQLEDANLTSANLRHADLRKADLQNANLEDADLFGFQWGAPVKLPSPCRTFRPHLDRVSLLKFRHFISALRRAAAESLRKETSSSGSPSEKGSLTPSLSCIPEDGTEMTGCSCAHEKVPDQVAVWETLRQVERDS